MIPDENTLEFVAGAILEGMDGIGNSCDHGLHPWVGAGDGGGVCAGGMEGCWMREGFE